MSDDLDLDALEALFASAPAVRNEVRDGWRRLIAMARGLEQAMAALQAARREERQRAISAIDSAVVAKCSVDNLHPQQVIEVAIKIDGTVCTITASARDQLSHSLCAAIRALGEPG